MSYEMDTRKAIKRYAQISRHLRAKYGDSIAITLGDCDSQINKIRLGHYILVNRIVGGGASLDFNKPNSVFYENVEKLFEPKFIQVETVCIDLIDNENIYLDKEKNVMVTSITKNGVVLDDGSIVEASRLYIKE